MCKNYKAEAQVWYDFNFITLMYSLFDRPSMIPKYMSFEEANQILETGRCMNFLHNICHQRPAPTPAQVMLSELEKNKCKRILIVFMYTIIFWEVTDNTFLRK